MRADALVSRRALLVGGAGAGAALLAAWFPGEGVAATDDDLAFANFAIAAELLLADFYATALAANVVRGAGRDVLRAGRRNAAAHAKALAALLIGAGDSAPERDDFEFVWPKGTFATAPALARVGRKVLGALSGVYQTAAASSTEPTYRVLFSSLAVSAGQQLGYLDALAAGTAMQPFPVALDLEAATGRVQAYFG